MTHDARRPHGPRWWTESNHRRFAGGREARIRYFRRMRFGALVLFFLALSGLMAGGWRLAEALPRAVVPLGILFVIFSALAMSRVFGAARRFSSPLNDVMDAADRVADGDYGVRVAETGPPPIRALIRSFNTMTARLSDADRLRRDLMADLAHELRTPLSVLQGKLEGVIDGIYPTDREHLAQLLEETHVLSRLIDDLRTLALSEAGALPLQLESVDLTTLVRDAIRSMERGGVAVEMSAPEGVTLDADPIRIREVLTNLLSNAIRHTQPGARVTVTVDDAKDGVVLVVRDTGAGIPPEDLGRLFDRFYKGSASRGSGLGLAIAKAIVTAHGGTIRASSVVGEGTTIEFTLPRSILKCDDL